MPRLRQINANTYKANAQIDGEFANIVRYLNAAEVGNKTIGELLAQIFSDQGVVKGIVELRVDTTLGLQWRSGTYTSATEGWSTISSLASIRGPAGADFGDVGEPTLASRADYVATSGQTVFSYSFDSTDTLVVYKNGLLLRSGSIYDYTSNSTNSTVTLVSAAALSDRLSIYRVRSGSNFSRTDTYTISAQSAFATPAYSSTASIQVFKNGVLLRSGASYDYTISGTTVTFNSPIPTSNLVSILIIDTGLTRPVAGLMTETKYTDTATGLINYSSISVPDAAIAQTKVSGLTALNASAARLYVSTTTPGSIPSGQGGFWLNTSTSPAILYVWQDTQWVLATQASAVPTFAIANAGQYLRVNNGGTALAFSPIDLSSAIPVTAIGAASGVASLDTNGRLNSSQLPTDAATETLYLNVAGAVANSTKTLKMIWRQKLTIRGIVIQTASGTCTVAVYVNGVAVSSSYVASSTRLEQTLGSTITVDGLISSKSITIVITSTASATDLEVALACTVSAV
jgi:hypothetical protein